MLSGWAAAAPMGTDYDVLLRQKDFLEAQAMLENDHAITTPERQYVQGVLANRSGAVARSLELLVPLRTAALSDPERETTVLQTLGDDYAKIGAYAESADAYGELIRRFGSLLSERVRKTAIEDVGVFDQLRSAPPQTVVLAGPQTVPLSTNRLGLQEMPVQVAGRDDSWVLDTGANLSTISLGVARALGLTLSSKAIQTEGLTGDPVDVHVAVLPELRIGKAIVRNVVVLVATDEALSAGGYSLHGIVGFPVLFALQRLTFSTNVLRLDDPLTAAPASRLFMDEMTPLISASAEGVAHLFTLDAYSGEVDRPFRRNVTGDSAESTL